MKKTFFHHDQLPRDQIAAAQNPLRYSARKELVERMQTGDQV